MSQLQRNRHLGYLSYSESFLLLYIHVWMKPDILKFWNPAAVKENPSAFFERWLVLVLAWHLFLKDELCGKVEWDVIRLLFCCQTHFKGIWISSWPEGSTGPTAVLHEWHKLDAYIWETISPLSSSLKLNSFYRLEHILVGATLGCSDFSLLQRGSVRPQLKKTLRV